MKKTLCLLFVAWAGAAVGAYAQETPSKTAPANPISTSEKGAYGYISGIVVAAAEKMPEENYSFKPTPDVRSFGQLVGHVADAQYDTCATAMGEQPQMKNFEKTKTSKADLLAALKGSVSYCEKAYAGMTDAQGAQMTKMDNYAMAKLTLLSLNTAHIYEHYGNMVTYMRLKGLVPPSSEKQPSQGQK
ncbi:MAG TPA: DinB family protein [Bryobacteraceae bacterium]|nr:DinB family protein [Bryobacteraceae bacterium]